MIMAASSGASVAIALIALALSILGAVALVAVFRGSRGKNLAELQGGAVASLQGELDAQKARGDRLEADNRGQQRQLDSQEKRITDQQNQILMLQDMVKQVAKVDELRKAVDDHALGLNGRLDKLVLALETGRPA